MAHWQDDETAFKERFKISYPDFCRLISALTPEDQARYDSICAASKRAAILWAIDQGRIKGLISDDQGKRTVAHSAMSPFVEAAHNALAASEAKEEE